jgi:hypothetical protein
MEKATECGKKSTSGFQDGEEDSGELQSIADLSNMGKAGADPDLAKREGVEGGDLWRGPEAAFADCERGLGEVGEEARGEEVVESRRTGEGGEAEVEEGISRRE